MLQVFTVLADAKRVVDSQLTLSLRWSEEAKGRLKMEKAKGAAMEAEAMKIKDPKQRALALLRPAVIAR